MCVLLNFQILLWYACSCSVIVFSVLYNVTVFISSLLCWRFVYRDIDMAEFLSSDPAVQDAHPHTVYDLMASICHSGQAGSGKGTYHVHIRHKASYTICTVYACVFTSDSLTYSSSITVNVKISWSQYFVG